MRNRTEQADYREIAERTGLPETEVKRVVRSFFAVILSDAKALPLDDPRRILSREKFEQYGDIVNIPSIGRFGPSYTRYLRWRANASREVNQKPRSAYRLRMTPSEIENMADAILSGGTFSLEKKRGNEMYNRVWLVGKDGKRQARQVIPKE